MTKRIGFTKDYKPFVGFIKNDKLSPYKSVVVDMIDETHRTYDAKCFRAVVIMSAETVHRVNCEVILLLGKQGVNIILPPKKGRKREQISEDEFVNNGDVWAKILNEFSIFHAINWLEKHNLFDDEIFSNMHMLRNLRNQATHSWDFPWVNDYRGRNQKKFTVKEVIEYTFRNEPLPPESMLYTITCNSKEYLIDPEELRIDLEVLPDEAKIATIVIATMVNILEEQINVLDSLTAKK